MDISLEKNANPLPEEVFQPCIPGSKSLTNRALALAFAGKGRTTLTGALNAQDTSTFGSCIGSFGKISVAEAPGLFVVENKAGKARPSAPNEALFIGAAGTPARFLLSMAADADGESSVTGTARLCERPMDSGIAALRALGIDIAEQGAKGCLPVKIRGGKISERAWSVDGSVSSQFVSSMLLCAGRQEPGSSPIIVEATGNLVSRPYIEMTTRAMNDAGVPVRQISPRAWEVTPTVPSVSEIHVEPDASALSYFLGAAAVLGGTTRIDGIGRSSSQGDARFANVLAEMGCTVRVTDSTIEMDGAPDGLRGIDVDMESMPDMVLTLAIVAAFAKGSTRITNIANLRLKECDRIQAAASELRRLGVRTWEGDDWLEIIPDGHPLQPATVKTYDDHRVAMAFSIAALRCPGIKFEDPSCVAKSFPGYWGEYARLCEFYGLVSPTTFKEA